MARHFCCPATARSTASAGSSGRSIASAALLIQGLVRVRRRDENRWFRWASAASLMLATRLLAGALTGRYGWHDSVVASLASAARWLGTPGLACAAIAVVTAIWSSSALRRWRSSGAG
jgi:uncharacterized membrane protein YeiB